jgi:hypothetical protein
MTKTYIRENDTDVLKNDIYEYKIVNNVIIYSYENYNSWAIHSSDNNTSNPTYYLIIDTLYNDALSHWVYESAIYILLYLKLKIEYPTLKIHIKTKKIFKQLFFDYFNITPENITFTLDSNNVCIFPLPISSHNTHTLSETCKLQIEAFIDTIQPNDSKKTLHTLIMPRQLKENFKNNDRAYNIDNIISGFQDLSNNRILRTDTITNIKEQMEIVNSAENLIVTGGSPYLLNGMFCKNTNIIVLDSDFQEQFRKYIKYTYYHNRILKNNRVHFVSKHTLTYEAIKPLLKASELHND